MYQVTVPMALVDYLPVFFFGISALILQQDLYNKMCKGTFALFAAGTINVFVAGFCKATSSRTPSTIFRMRSTSPEKSAWPGVSTILIL